MSNDKKPAIRFKDYSDDWEQRKLGELGEIMTGSTPSTSKSEYYSEDGIPWVTPTDINALTISDTSRKLSEKGMEVGRVVPANTILCTCIASIGKNALLTVKGSFNQQINSLTPSAENDAYFLLTESELWSKKMKQIAASGTMQIVNKTEFSELTTLIPAIDEQMKIGEHFKTLDHLITLHQRKYDKLQNLKKAMLEKMFPKNGSNVPEIRFKGFTDDWEQRKLGELVEIGDIDHRMPETVADGIPYLMTGDFIATNELNFDGVKMISEEDYCQLSQKIKPEKGDILFARYASVGAARYVDFTREFLISYSCAIIKKGRKVNSKYLYHFITSNNAQRQIKLEINTGSQANIGIDSMKNNIVVSMPSTEEQTKIADVLSNFDHLITLHQRELEKLKNIKKVMLEKMFV